MTNTFPESDLHFRFPDDWVVRKFDATRAYQSLSGHGLKGVDFIALSPDGKLWLMEVKNYRPRFVDGKEYRAKRRRPGELVGLVDKKFKDSQRLLQIVDVALRRNWWFSLWERYRMVFPDKDSNYWFWTEAKRRGNDPACLVYVLWMETPEEPVDYDLAVKAELRLLMGEEVALYVVETKRKTGIPIQVVSKGPASAAD